MVISSLKAFNYYLLITVYYLPMTKKEITMLNENDLAPDFEALDDAGRPVRLADLRGQRVMLYFFPKAMTSG